MTTALVMGVANHRSIAWACVRAFVEQGTYDHVVFTYQQGGRFDETTARRLTETLLSSSSSSSVPSSSSSSSPHHHGCTSIHSFPCNVETDIPTLFQNQLPSIFLNNNNNDKNERGGLNAIVHSIAHAPNLKHSSLLDTSSQDFQISHHISSYSLLEVARESLPWFTTRGTTTGGSITTLSYLGANRAIPHYNVMGSCKASLEALVRGLALELGSNGGNNKDGIRVNAVSAGPLITTSSRGIMGLSDIRQDMIHRAPLKRNITVQEVANVICFLSSPLASAITGQTIYVDGGYNIVAGPAAGPAGHTQ